MITVSPAWENLVSSLHDYEEGDFLTAATWIPLLGQLESQVPEARRESVRGLSRQLSQALQDGALEGLADWLGRELETLAPAHPAPKDDLWEQHGPMFVSETRNRLVRAEEITLLLETSEDPELVGELFRVFHTIKGEAGFLHRDDLSALAHRTEELLESLRSGSLAWSGTVADRVLGGIDDLNRALGLRGQKTDHPSEEVLRVPASKIDALISQIGELLIAHEDETSNRFASVRKLGRALQQSALRLRTEPLGDLMVRLKRGARDLARDLGKQVEVSLSGMDLELDRTLIAVLEEPLMHLIRNALDHGLESAPDRTVAGKVPEGRLSIDAQRRGNQIVISIGDDGRGLNTQKIWKKGLEKGLVSGDPPADARIVHELIFRPGFSTADQLSEVSGRGVGMDIVASSVRSARGQLEVLSRPGAGTRVAMTFPLSTAVLDALIVSLGKRKFLLPVHSVLESMTVRESDLTTLASGAQILSLRGDPLEVFSLRRILDRRADTAPPPWGVVTETSKGERQVLLVDQVDGKKEAVIRSLGKLFQRLQGVSAATVLAGGVPALVLDVDQLVQLARRMA